MEIEKNEGETSNRYRKTEGMAMSSGVSLSPAIANEVAVNADVPSLLSKIYYNEQNSNYV